MQQPHKCCPMNLMTLTKAILPDQQLAHLGKTVTRPVAGLTLDSRSVEPGVVFFANQRALARGGEAYIEEALHLGALAVFYEAQGAPASVEAMGLPLSGYPVIPLTDYYTVLGQMASRYYGDPSHHLTLIGVTGTNGKTSTAYFMAHALQAHGCPCGFIGTLGAGFPDDLGGMSGGTLTTPDVISLHRTLAALREQGANVVAMEVSSHGLAQHRVAGAVFDTAIFTNLTHDHLDYHKTFEDYAATKARLFQWPGLKNVIVNHDDPKGRQLAAMCLAEGKSVYTYGCAEDWTPPDNKNIAVVQAEFQPKKAFGLAASITLFSKTYSLYNPSLLGSFTLSNLLAVLWVLHLEGIGPEASLALLSALKAVPGRLEVVGHSKGLPLVVVDYAHTPDALEKSLKALRTLCHPSSKLWCVFGCGGDRDKEKRPRMGAIAENYSDKIILTSDNTRSENPASIVADIQSGLSEEGKKNSLVQLDRGAAISEAIRQAGPDDTVLIAGKGHETYQLIQGYSRYFSDKMQAITALYQRELASKTAFITGTVVSSLAALVQRLSQQGLLRGVVAVHQHVDKPITFNSVSIDTRTLKPGALFVAIQGEQFDGHEFVPQAEQQGAVAVLTQRPIDGLSIPQLYVDDTVLALGAIGRLARDSVTIPVVGLTGSCGKTTTKALIASIFRQAGRVLATAGNLNNYYGVPLTLSALTTEVDFAVVEMGANQPGEIAYLTQLVRPTVALITNASTAHLAGFKSVDGVAKTKGAIYEGLPEKGVAIINADDEKANYWRTVAAEHRIVTFGFTEEADVTAQAISIDQSTGAPSFNLVTSGNVTPVRLTLLGKHNVANALAAAAVALAVGLDNETIKKGLEAATPEDKRLVRYRTSSGAIVIDDTYNANPLSVRAALHVLAEHAGRKIFVMGDMGELGDDAADYHRAMGEQAKQLGIDYLLTQGSLSRQASLAFGSSAYHFNTSQSLIQALRPLLDENTMVVVKGSRAARMEVIVGGVTNKIEAVQT